MGLLDLYNSGGTQLNQITTDLTTQYPSTTTGTPTTSTNPGGPVVPFQQTYDATNTYLSVTHDKLENTLPITNYDVEDSGVAGGPNTDITTQYPSTVTGTPTTTQNPGGPVTNFSQPNTPNNTYLSNVGTGQLENTLPITNLDIENPGVIGGPNTDTTTQYPPTVTGTPTNTQNPGGPVTNFSQPNTPSNTYLGNIGTGQLENTLDITNYDVENSGVIGGPNADTTTSYPANVTGTPTNTQNPGGPVVNFSQPNTPVNPYINSVGNGQLENTLPVTNLDVESPGVSGGPNDDTITNFSVWNTGTPNYLQNPGAAPKRFKHKYLPTLQYAATNPVAGVNSGILYNVNPLQDNSLKITNLDTTEPGVQGGTPYSQLKDPTIYPPTTNHSSGVRGFFAQPASASGKFYQLYSTANTYLSFIGSYI